jgi:signal transduction histidine kinase
VSVVQRQADALMQAKARIASGERMESLGRLAAGVAHDFNNVLHVVRLATGSVRESLTNESDRQALDDATAAATHGTALVSQLLTFARQQTRDPQPFDAFDRLRTLTPMLQRIVGDGVECTVTLADAAAVIVMDPAQFEQIAINLVTNARDAVPHGGRIEVDLGVASVIRGASATANVSPGDYVRLTVEDNGHGIPIEIRSRIFEPFFTTKGRDHGSGLGLATVHGIVQGAGGAITVESTPGHGTRFEVYLPAVDAVQAASIARPVLPPNACATAATDAALVAPVGGACPASAKASTPTPR